MASWKPAATDDQECSQLIDAEIQNHIHEAAEQSPRRGTRQKVRWSLLVALSIVGFVCTLGALNFYPVASRLDKTTSSDAFAEEFPGVCSNYVNCKCVVSTLSDSQVSCVPKSSKWHPKKKFWCWGSAKDEQNTPESWADCEWANFETGDYAKNGALPGEGIMVDVPPLPSTIFANGTYVPGLFQDGAQVFSDMDDTMVCSNGGGGFFHKIAGAFKGVDSECTGTSEAKRWIYPGMVEFLLALSRGTGNIINPEKVIPLSARPDELQPFLGLDNDKVPGPQMRATAEKAGILGWGLDVERAQYGKVADGTAFLPFSAGWHHLAQYQKLGVTKFENWKELALEKGAVAKPVVFVGDNGQGDNVGAQMMLLRSSAFPAPGAHGATRASFIHVVGDHVCDQVCQDAYAKVGIYTFTNYVYAALKAKAVGIISDAGKDSVCKAAREPLKELWAAGPPKFQASNGLVVSCPGSGSRTNAGLAVNGGPLLKGSER